jgi:hypothetical protein
MIRFQIVLCNYNGFPGDILEFLMIKIIITRQLSLEIRHARNYPEDGK